MQSSCSAPKPKTALSSVDHVHPMTAVKHVVWPDQSSGYGKPEDLQVTHEDDDLTVRSIEAATDHTCVVLSTDNAW